MKDTEIKIRKATKEDAGDILGIYAPYVEDTAISFEYEVPLLSEMEDRIEKTEEMYPYLVAECDGSVIGYAYAGPFVGREAYDHSAELSVYISADERGQGIGTKLYKEIEKELKKMNVFNLYACIGHADTEDEYLTNDSEKFHAHLGFRNIGKFSKCGYKFGRWYDMVWMEKIIGDHGDDVKDFRPCK